MRLDTRSHTKTGECRELNLYIFAVQEGTTVFLGFAFKSKVKSDDWSRQVEEVDVQVVIQAWEVEARIWKVVVYASHLLLRTCSVHLYKALVSVISGEATPKQREGDKLSLIMLMMMLMMILMMMLMLMLNKSETEVTVTGALLGVHLCSNPEVRCLNGKICASW